MVYYKQKIHHAKVRILFLNEMAHLINKESELVVWRERMEAVSTPLSISSIIYFSKRRAFLLRMRSSTVETLTNTCREPRSVA